MDGEEGERRKRVREEEMIKRKAQPTSSYLAGTFFTLLTLVLIHPFRHPESPSR